MENDKNLCKKRLVELTLQQRNMPKNNECRSHMSDEDIENWKKVEKLFRLAKKI